MKAFKFNDVKASTFRTHRKLGKFEVSVLRGLLFRELSLSNLYLKVL